MFGDFHPVESPSYGYRPHTTYVTFNSASNYVEIADFRFAGPIHGGEAYCEPTYFRVLKLEELGVVGALVARVPCD